LRSTLESKQCDDVYGLLSKHYEQCRKRFYHFQVTRSPSYKCSFQKSQLDWLGELLNAWPVGGKANQIPEFSKKHSGYNVSLTLRQFGLDRHEILRVKTSLQILTLLARPKATTNELEELSIRCGEMSKCQLCEYAHITTNYVTEEMRFRGCLENPKIEESIFGECSLFLRRGLVDEQNVA
jgi:hypothetical protein